MQPTLSLLILFLLISSIISCFSRVEDTVIQNSQGTPKEQQGIRKLKLIKARVIMRHGDRTTVYKPKKESFQKKLDSFFGTPGILDDTICTTRKFKIENMVKNFGLKIKHFLKQYEMANSTLNSKGSPKITPYKFEDYPKELIPGQSCYYGQLTEIGVRGSQNLGKQLHVRFFDKENNVIAFEQQKTFREDISIQKKANSDYFSMFSATSCFPYVKQVLFAKKENQEIDNFLKKYTNFKENPKIGLTNLVILDRNLPSSGIFDSISLRSTNYDRTIETVEQVFIGIINELKKEIPENEQQTFREIPMTVEDPKTTILVVNDNSLAAIFKIMRDCEKSELWKKHHESEFVHNLKQSISSAICKDNSLGPECEKLDDFPSLESIFDIFICRNSHAEFLKKKGLLPENLLNDLLKNAEKEWYFYMQDGQYAFKTMVSYLDDLLTSFKSAKHNHRIELDGGHDASLAPLLRLFDLIGVFGTRPGYNSHFIFELFESENNKAQNYVVVSYDGKSVNLPFCEEKLGDFSLCTLEEFESFVIFLKSITKLLEN